MSYWGVDDYIIFNSEQVKSATDNNGNFDPADPDIYHQAVMRIDEFMLTPEAQKQMYDVRKQYEGTMQWLKALNGKPTNLTEQQWLAVRTSNFKRWFGDWENAPEHASKVLDENGEPLVVYHGTPKGGFSVLNTEGTGAWFSSSYDTARTYTYGGKKQNRQVYAVFLNIRNPFIYKAKGRKSNQLSDVWVYNHDTDEKFETKQDGSYFINQNDAYKYISDVLGDKNHEHYDILIDDKYYLTDDIVRAVWNKELGS